MKSRNKTLALALVFAAALSTSISSFSQPAGGQGGPGGGEHRRGPPPEAVDACKGKAAGAVCNFTDREGEKLTGTCFAPPPRQDDAGKGTSEKPLACRPDRGGKGPGAGKSKG
jgi:hypothetical protein